MPLKITNKIKFFLHITNIHFSPEYVSCHKYLIIYNILFLCICHYPSFQKVHNFPTPLICLSYKYCLCSVWDLRASLWCTDSLVVVCGLRSCVVRAPELAGSKSCGMWALQLWHMSSGACGLSSRGLQT